MLAGRPGSSSYIPHKIHLLSTIRTYLSIPGSANIENLVPVPRKPQREERAHPGLETIKRMWFNEDMRVFDMFFHCSAGLFNAFHYMRMDSHS